jgi:radical SAM superfamily enzyme YgiQ (UPF0313 family)
MRVAIIFPPQWDPRQPPLCVPTLAAAARVAGGDLRVWDMNLFLYRWVLAGASSSAATRRLLDEYLSRDCLKEPRRFQRINAMLEDAIYFGYDPSGMHRLYWDCLEGILSPDKSTDWKTAVREPAGLPYHAIIRPQIDAVVNWRPDVACISAISDTQLLCALSIASTLRLRLRDAKIIVGGHAFRERRDLLPRHKWLFETVDAVCVSHGEPCVSALVRGADIPETPNVIWHDGKDVRKPRILEPAFSEAMPDFSVIAVNDYLASEIVIPIETARGCPWGKCSFCGHPCSELRPQQRYVPRPLTSVIREVELHCAQGHNAFFFVDEAIPYSRFKGLAWRLKALSKSVTWLCYLRPEKRHSRETFTLAHKAGCRKVFIGLETGSARLLKLHRKGTTPQIAARVLTIAAAARLAVHVFLIAGFPDESEADRAATEALLADVLPSMDAFGFTYNVFPLSAERGTPLFRHPSRFGVRRLTTETGKDLSPVSQMVPSNPAAQIPHAEACSRIGKLVARHLGPSTGLRHMNLSQDSTHLSLLTARSFPCTVEAGNKT